VLVRRWPDLEVCVHERGAPHLIDPTKLLAAARQPTARRWSACGRGRPLPEGNLRVLQGGEEFDGLDARRGAGRQWR
jgi:hypothetical protein